MSLCTDIIPPKEYDAMIGIPVHGEPWINIGGFSGPHVAIAWVKNGRVIASLWGERPTFYSEPGPRVDAPEFAWPTKTTP